MFVSATPSSVHAPCCREPSVMHRARPAGPLAALSLWPSRCKSPCPGSRWPVSLSLALSVRAPCPRRPAEAGAIPGVLPSRPVAGRSPQAGGGGAAARGRAVALGALHAAWGLRVPATAFPLPARRAAAGNGGAAAAATAAAAAALPAPRGSGAASSSSSLGLKHARTRGSRRGRGHGPPPRGAAAVRWPALVRGAGGRGCRRPARLRRGRECRSQLAAGAQGAPRCR